jgi:uracil-DNA glycosylase family 4
MIELNVRGYDTSDACAQCPCARNGQPFKPVRSFGGTGGLAIIGEAPVQEAQAQGFPFIGPAGKIVNKALQKAGADRAYIWMGYSLLCRLPFGDEARDLAVQCCSARLRADLELAQPTAICALGVTAMRALGLPVTVTAQARGTVQESPLFPGVPVIATIHPAALLHGGAGEMGKGGKQKMNVDAQAMFLHADIAKAFRVAIGEVDPKWSDDIIVIHEANDVRMAVNEILAEIYEWGVLGLDLEWLCDGSKNALDALGAGAHRALITWVGIGCGTRSVSFKWDALIAEYNERGQEFPDGSGALDSGLMRLQAAMEDESLPKLAHNKQADKAVWEAQVGPIKGKIMDSMLMHHVAFPGIDHDLQQVTSQFLCVPPWKVDHSRAIAEHAARMREEAQVAKTAEKEQKKVEKKIKHETANAEKAAKAAEAKAAKKAAHEARNAAAAAGGKRPRKKKGLLAVIEAEQQEFVGMLAQARHATNVRGDLGQSELLALGSRAYLPPGTLPPCRVSVHGIPYSEHPDPAADDGGDEYRYDLEDLPF